MWRFACDGSRLRSLLEPPYGDGALLPKSPALCVAPLHALLILPDDPSEWLAARYQRQSLIYQRHSCALIPAAQILAPGARFAPCGPSAFQQAAARFP